MRLFELTSRNMLWPLVAAPVVFLFGQLILWGLTMVAADYRLPIVLPSAETEGEFSAPLYLLTTDGTIVFLVAAICSLALLPMAIATGRWSAAAYRAVGDAPGAGFPRVFPLPAGLAEGTVLQGRVVESGSYMSKHGQRSTRKSYRTYIVELDAPFDPPVRIGFSFERRRERSEFAAHLDDLTGTDTPVRLRLADGDRCSPIPLAANGDLPPDGIADELIQQNR